MKEAVVYAPGEKTHRDENFPVASYMLRKEHRAPIMAYYRFARATDDIADHPHLSEQEKITQLDQFEATLLGRNDAMADALPLRAVLEARGLSPRHALDLLIAFRQDASKGRYRDWSELMQYCSYSAAPVGRFVLEVHGESRDTWGASDALCSALQIINHLQDCKADYLRLNRVYVPQDALARHGLNEIALAQDSASPGLSACLKELAEKTQSLLADPLSPQVNDGRLRLEVSVIERLARRLITVLRERDPLSERVHLARREVISVVVRAVLATLVPKVWGPNRKELEEA